VSAPDRRRLPEALRDGRKVWVIGEGAVEDVTTHPATRAMVDEYVACMTGISIRSGRTPC
jgi:aromatic ring hydroxylase